MLGLLYVVVLTLQVVLPPGHPLREATGGSAADWLVLGGVGLAVWGYSRLLAQVRAGSAPENRRRGARTPRSRPLRRGRSCRATPATSRCARSAGRDSAA